LLSQEVELVVVDNLATTRVVVEVVLEVIGTLMLLKHLEKTPQQRHPYRFHNQQTTQSQLVEVDQLVLVENKETKDLIQILAL
jgi:hypothetical protein